MSSLPLSLSLSAPLSLSLFLVACLGDVRIIGFARLPHKLKRVLARDNNVLAIEDGKLRKVHVHWVDVVGVHVHKHPLLPGPGNRELCQVIPAKVVDLERLAPACVGLNQLIEAMEEGGRRQHGYVWW